MEGVYIFLPLSVHARKHCGHPVDVSQFWLEAMAKRSLMVVNFATGEKVSKKSIPSNWVYPLATNLALCHSMEPSDLYLILKTHLHPMGFFPGGRSVTIQVLL